MHFVYGVQASTVNNTLKISTNYRIFGPLGSCVLKLSQTANEFSFQQAQAVGTANIKDFFKVGRHDRQGKYILELLIRNKLTGEARVLSKEFWVR